MAKQCIIACPRYAYILMYFKVHNVMYMQKASYLLIATQHLDQRLLSRVSHVVTDKERTRKKDEKKSHGVVT